MLQSGVGTGDLDVRWVSSLSWYFLTLFGLQPVYNFILGSNNGKFINRDSRLSAADVFHSRKQRLTTDGHAEPWCGHGYDGT
jgi:hypothetical protein